MGGRIQISECDCLVELGDSVILFIWIVTACNINDTDCHCSSLYRDISAYKSNEGLHGYK